MGNTESRQSHHKHPTRKGSSPGGSSPNPNFKKSNTAMRRTKSTYSARRRLKSHDLDDIYDFVMHMKQSKTNEDALDEFILKQSSNLEENEDTREEMLAKVMAAGSAGAKSLAASMEPPIKNIAIVKDGAAGPRRHCPTVSPSA